MSPKYKKPEVLQRRCIKERSFYARTEKTERNPFGIIRLYRVTLNPPHHDGDFTWQAVRIKSPEELTKTKLALDWLANSLNWQELPEVLKEFKQKLRKEKEEKEISPTTLKLIHMYPEAAEEILKGFDKVFRGHIEIEDFPIVEKVVETATNLLANQTRHMIDTKLELLERLNRETTTKGIERLTKLLEKHSLPKLTSVTNIIMDRIQRINYFKATIQNDKAYELKGEDSVHNQLARSLWIIDDSYWLLYSNKTLATFLQKKTKHAPEDERKRPDLICATDRNRLVIVELKRPRDEIVQDDIHQLHNYLRTADKFRGQGFKTKIGYLIGREISDYDRNYLEDIPILRFKTYLELVEDCERRYQEYLVALKKDEQVS
jgi:hypothetical protein